jgi:hypothetical protein
MRRSRACAGLAISLITQTARGAPLCGGDIRHPVLRRGRDADMLPRSSRAFARFVFSYLHYSLSLTPSDIRRNAECRPYVGMRVALMVSMPLNSTEPVLATLENEPVRCT